MLETMTMPTPDGPVEDTMTEHPMPAETNLPILAAVDGSAVSYHAVAWAAVEAALYRRPLTLITSVSLPVGWGMGAMLTATDTEWLQTEGERVLTEATRVARDAAPEVPDIRAEVVWVPVIPALIERSRHAAMLVVGSRGVGALRGGLLGSVSTAVVRHAHCPVAVIHGPAATDPVSATRPVLVGVDGSENSLPAVELAFEEASRRKVGLTAVHAWSDLSGMDVPMMGWDDTVRESEDAVLAESLAGWSERFPDVAVRRILVRDRPVRALLDESENAQLVVVGSHGRGGFTGMLLGSTSNALVHSVECPTVVVRKRAAE
jgi:nucleotide-binding universal stress UspA family protein